MNETDVLDCVIVGGGFTGLAAAADLSEAGRSVAVIEKEQTLGGLAAGFETDGYELERFYHHWFTSDLHITELAAQIGAQDQIILRESSTGMYYAGKRFRLSTPLDLLRFSAIPLHDRIRTGLATLAVRRVKNWRSLESLSAKEWLSRLFGRNAYRIIWEPLLIGKFGQYADEVSAVWFWNKLALRGSSRSTDGGERLAYYRGGFARLARTVAEHIERRGGDVRTDVAVTGFRTVDPGRILVETTQGRLTARSVLITTPLPNAADLLAEVAPADYLKDLRRIKFLGNVCLILELSRSLSGLYWTNVNDPSFPFVGVIEHTNFEPTESYGGHHVVYLSKYLPVEDPLYSMNAAEALAFAVPHLRRMFPDFDEAWVVRCHLWRAPYAQPIVVKHYSALIPPFETPVDNIFLASMAQVYPEDRGTNYAVREGKRAAADIRRRLDANVAPDLARRLATT